MMRVLESWEYGDPEQVVIRREEEAQRKEKACGQCAHKISIEFRGDVLRGCEFQRRQYGWRCELYEVKKF